MRIISGKYKGKKLNQPIDISTRPLRDIVKESIFNLLTHSNNIRIDLPGAYVLDLFSGTGSFGLECISRGARKVVFCENYKPVLAILKKNINSLNEIKNIEIKTENIFNKLGKKEFDITFNLIFLDPPYKEQKINLLLSLISESNILKKDGLIVLHRNKKQKDIIDIKHEILLEKVYGISRIFFIKL